MKLTTFNYSVDQGWSIQQFPEAVSEHTVIFIFGTSNMEIAKNPIHELQQLYPLAHFIGCSSSGEIFGTQINDDTLSVALVEFDSAQIRSISQPIVSTESSYDVGTAISAALSAPDLKAIFVLSDGIHINGSQLVAGINEHIDSKVLVAGGLAGDAARFAKTWVVSDQGELCNNQVAAIGLYGERLDIQCSSKGGWDIFGPERRITKSVNNVLYEIDGQPALSLYKRYLGERAEELPSSALLFPLTIRSNKDGNQQVVRTILGVNEEDQSMTFAGDIPEGWYAQLMRANYDRLIAGASSAGEMIHLNDDQQPTLSLAISCVGRRLVLGERAEEETEACFEVLPAKTQQIGFYSYGEISPLRAGNCMLHNQTMTLTVIRESVNQG